MTWSPYAVSGGVPASRSPGSDRPRNGTVRLRGVSGPDRTGTGIGFRCSSDKMRSQTLVKAHNAS
ncbi:hypothetical protein SAMN00768000_3549 [Sulfobacillus thermosulfidooxidans DSM 9293]|uniref:Uncharacterized protein n=1 Tax=Sulfobacillus thermosulfidooxidans (strain DSM 9293 / VKM B-1269 / AT-1) TaxID=929705 RepID=A0A1W1WNZ9_SULTA|nr:hypothetical protein [Sulfobacillus thermosulfidooxidans]SMC07956.1 hypothetical protein SAMN00768000_3549 [Sulfobacillus thermosulfidooxidans DSM 9293]